MRCASKVFVNRVWTLTLIATHSSLDWLHGTLMVSVTTPFLKLNNSTKKGERGKIQRGGVKLISQCDTKGKGYLGWQVRNAFNYTPTETCAPLASTDRNISGTDCVPVAFWVIGQEKAGLIEWEVK